jgi:hypothetical protein
MDFLSGPIPGESLTLEPKSVPWEQPPKIDDPEEALNMHLSRLSDEKMIKDLAPILEMGMPISALTESILTSAVMKGIHSLDVSLIIAPVIHGFIESTARDLGIPFKTGFEEDEGAQDSDFIAAQVSKRLEETQNTEEPPMVEEPVEEPVMEEEPVAEEEPIIPRRDV